MFNISRIVSHLIIINLLLFFGAHLVFGNIIPVPNYEIPQIGLEARSVLGLWYPFGERFQPFQIVTHMFMHSDFNHLFFNMFALFMFGSHVERVWGQKKFLFYYLFTGLGALLAHLIVWYIEVNYFGVNSFGLVWGASGAVFGVLVAFAFLFPNMQIMLLIPPIPIRAKYLVLLYAGIELYLGFGNLTDGVAHFAHLGGALTGFLLILYWKKFGSRF